MRQYPLSVQPLIYVRCGSIPAGIDSPEDLGILYSNRAACYLKDGNSSDCIQDCTKYVQSATCSCVWAYFNVTVLKEHFINFSFVIL